MCSATLRYCLPLRPNSPVSKANARYRRSIFISIVSLGSLIWVATDQFDIPRETVGWMLVYTFIAVLGIIAFAAVCVAMWLGLRKLLARRP
jgi:hypothetical protein